MYEFGQHRIKIVRNHAKIIMRYCPSRITRPPQHTLLRGRSVYLLHIGGTSSTFLPFFCA